MLLPIDYVLVFLQKTFNRIKVTSLLIENDRIKIKYNVKHPFNSLTIVCFFVLGTFECKFFFFKVSIKVSYVSELYNLFINQKLF